MPELLTKTDGPAKKRLTLHGLDIAIENPKGSTRSGKDKDGRTWSTTMAHDYGYIHQTEGADGDAVDVFVGPFPESDRVFVVNQIDQETGDFDEHKVMLGFRSMDEARYGYLVNYDQGWRVGSIKEMTVPEFKDWLQHDDKRDVAKGPRRGYVAPGLQVTPMMHVRHVKSGRCGTVLGTRGDGRARVLLHDRGIVKPLDLRQGYVASIADDDLLKAGPGGAYCNLMHDCFPTPGALGGHVAATGHPVTGQVGEQALQQYGSERLRTTNPPLPGAAIQEYQQFARQFLGVGYQAFSMLNRDFGAMGAYVFGRVKSPESLREKIEVRRKVGVSDMVGTTVSPADYKAMGEVVQRVRAAYPVLEESDQYMTQPSLGYYRGHHFMVQVDGAPVEIQIMTQRMHDLKEWGHPKLYKGAPFAEDPEYRDYAARWSAHIDALDRGQDPGPEPLCPERIRANGHCFRLSAQGRQD